MAWSRRGRGQAARWEMRWGAGSRTAGWARNRAADRKEIGVPLEKA